MKESLKKILKEIGFVRSIYFWIRFVYNNKYFPDFKKPKTYNEKVNYRKRNAHNPLFSICADKIAAKDYVAEKIGVEYIIPNLYTGGNITLDKIQSLLTEHGDCILKANHNSGPVYLLTTNMNQAELKAACDDVNHQLTVDFGKHTNEPWYSDIKPQILVEKRIYPEQGDRDLKDYKFHMFRKEDGTYDTVLHIDFERSMNHSRSFFDENLNWLPFSMQYPCIVTQIAEPTNYQLMLSLAKKLADGFSYVRVDFYNVNGRVYFGELTFAHGSGCEAFTTKAHDLWMGNLWRGDPAT